MVSRIKTILSRKKRGTQFTSETENVSDILTREVVHIQACMHISIILAVEPNFFMTRSPLIF